MKHNVTVTTILITIFFVSQIIGLAIVSGYVVREKGEIVEVKNLPSIGGVEVERPQMEEKTSPIYFATAVIIGTLIIFFVMWLKRPMLWKIWYYMATFLCLTFAFGAFLPYAWVLALIVTLLKIFKKSAIIHNIAELFIYGGLGAIFVPIQGLTILSASVLMLIMSAYDAYSVWKSKHMIKLAKFQTSTGVFAGLHIPYKMPQKIPAGAKTVAKKVQSAVLGGGDIGFPIIFTGAVYKVFGWNALCVIPFTTLALGLLLWKSEKGKFYPALPFLTIGCLIGLIVTWTIG